MPKKPKNRSKYSMGQDIILEEMVLKDAIKRRRVHLHTYVTPDEVFKMAYYINKIVAQDKQTGKKLPITIEISSGGGRVYHGLQICSLLEQLKEQGYTIITEVTSMAASMAFMIAICGSKGHRRIYRYGSMLFHQVSSGVSGKLQDMEEGVEETRRLWLLLKEITLKNTDFTDERLEQIKREKLDYWMSPAECLELNIIDEVL